MASSNVQAAISKAAAELQSIERSLSTSQHLATTHASYSTSAMHNASMRSTRNAPDEHTDVDVATSPDGRNVRVSVHQRGDTSVGLRSQDLARDFGVSVGARSNSTAVLQALQMLQDRIKRLEKEKLKMQHDFGDLDSMFSRYRTSKDEELAEIERAFELERAQFKSKSTRFESQISAKTSELRDCSDNAHQLQLQIESLQRKLTQTESALRDSKMGEDKLGAELEQQHSRNASLRQDVEDLTEDLKNLQAAYSDAQQQNEVASQRLQTLVDLNRTLTRTLHTAPSGHSDSVTGAAAAGSGAAAAGPRKRLKKKRKAAKRTTTGGSAVTQQASSQLKAFSSAQDKPLPWVSSQYAGRSHSVLANAQITMSDPAAVGVKGRAVHAPTTGRAISSTSAPPPKEAARPPAASDNASRSFRAGYGPSEASSGPPSNRSNNAAQRAHGSLHAAAEASRVANETLGRVEAALAASSAHTAAHASQFDSSMGQHSSVSFAQASPGASRFGGDASFLGDADDASHAAAGAAQQGGRSVAWGSRTAGTRGPDVDPTFTASGRLIPHRTLAPERSMTAVRAALSGEIAELQSRYERLLGGLQQGGDGHGDGGSTAALSELALVLQDKMHQLELLRQASEEITDARERSPVRNPAAAARRTQALRTMQRMREIAAETSRIGADVSANGRDTSLLR